MSSGKPATTRPAGLGSVLERLGLGAARRRVAQNEQLLRPPENNRRQARAARLKKGGERNGDARFISRGRIVAGAVLGDVRTQTGPGARKAPSPRGARRGDPLLPLADFHRRPALYGSGKLAVQRRYRRYVFVPDHLRRAQPEPEPNPSVAPHLEAVAGEAADAPCAPAGAATCGLQRNRAARAPRRIGAPRLRTTGSALTPAGETVKRARPRRRHGRTFDEPDRGRDLLQVRQGDPD